MWYFMFFTLFHLNQQSKWLFYSLDYLTKPIQYYLYFFPPAIMKNMMGVFSVRVYLQWIHQGQIEDFKLGGGVHLKKLRREVRKFLEYFVWKIIFFPIAEGGAIFFWVFRVKNHNFKQKNNIFSNFRGGTHTRYGVCLHLDSPLYIRYASSLKIVIRRYVVFPNEGYLPHVSLEFFLWVFSCATQ
jgi:hypothetical protein